MKAEKIYKVVDVNDELPENSNTYHVEWHDDGRAIILGACTFRLWGKDEFDVSDEDDKDPQNPRGSQPDYWLKEEPEEQYCFSADELKEFARQVYTMGWANKVNCESVSMSKMDIAIAEQYLSSLNIKP